MNEGGDTAFKLILQAILEVKIAFSSVLSAGLKRTLSNWISAPQGVNTELFVTFSLRSPATRASSAQIDIHEPTTQFRDQLRHAASAIKAAWSLGRLDDVYGSC